MSLVPSISTISFEESRPVGPYSTTAVGAVDSDQLSSSDPANRVNCSLSLSLSLQPHIRISVQY